MNGNAIRHENTSNDGSQVGNPEKDFFTDRLPEKSKDDVVAEYFRCRYADRERFKRNPQHKILIEEEEERIARVRARLHCEVPDLPIFQALDGDRLNWREYAIKQSDCNLEHVPQKFESLREQLKKRLRVRESHGMVTEQNLNQRLSERAKDEERILRKVKGWKKDVGIAPPFHLTSPECIPDDRNVRELVLEKSTQEDENSVQGFVLKGKMEKHNIEDFLGEEGEKFFRKQEKDTIRYFHLPANNMDWVEVSA